MFREARRISLPACSLGLQLLHLRFERVFEFAIELVVFICNHYRGLGCDVVK
jgi:hypothetical protein